MTVYSMPRSKKENNQYLGEQLILWETATENNIRLFHVFLQQKLFNSWQGCKVLSQNKQVAPFPKDKWYWNQVTQSASSWLKLDIRKAGKFRQVTNGGLKSFKVVFLD